MTKLSFSQISEARSNPAAFKAKMSSANPPSGFGWYPLLLLQYELMHWHVKGQNAQASRDIVKQKLESKFPTSKQKERILAQFDEYVEGFQALNHTFALAWKNVEVLIPDGPQVLGRVTGRVPRIDIVPGGGYAAWLFSTNDGDRTNDIRMPLTQLGVAGVFGCPADDVSVGVYSFQSGAYEMVDSDAGLRQSAIRNMSELFGLLR